MIISGSATPASSAAKLRSRTIRPGVTSCPAFTSSTSDLFRTGAASTMPTWRSASDTPRIATSVVTAVASSAASSCGS